MAPRHTHLSGLLLMLTSLSVGAVPPPGETPVEVNTLTTAPTIDGDLGDWPDTGLTLSLTPAVENDRKNRTGNIDAALFLGTHGGYLYVAARWPDKRANTDYRPWRWKGNRYKRSRRRDDMFAIRFRMDGQYDRCMIAESEYRVDVWQWSAGRSNPAGSADDAWHLVTTRLLENAAEYPGPSGQTVYIRKSRDAGEPGYSYTRPNRRKFQGKQLAAVAWPQPGHGSVADIEAKGVWREGYWHLEMRRKLDTGHADDANLAASPERLGAIAIFNQGYAEHKSVSGTLRLRFRR